MINHAIGIGIDSSLAYILSTTWGKCNFIRFIQKECEKSYFDLRKIYAFKKYLNLREGMTLVKEKKQFG